MTVITFDNMYDTLLEKRCGKPKKIIRSTQEAQARLLPGRRLHHTLSRSSFCLLRLQPSNMSVLSKLPQKLSSPFALLGDEAKLAFRSQPSGITKLASTRVRSIRCIKGIDK
jgi:hypothetical protein